MNNSETLHNITALFFFLKKRKSWWTKSCIVSHYSFYLLLIPFFQMQLLLDRTSAKILFILDLFHKQHKDPIFPSWCIIAPLTVGQCVTAEKWLRLHCRHVSALTPVAPENQSRRNKYCARNWLKGFYKYLSWKADKKRSSSSQNDTVNAKT